MVLKACYLVGAADDDLFALIGLIGDGAFRFTGPRGQRFMVGAAADNAGISRLQGFRCFLKSFERGVQGAVVCVRAVCGHIVGLSVP